MYRDGDRLNLRDRGTGNRHHPAIPATQLDEAGMQAAIDLAIAETGASSVKDMGQVMAFLKKGYAGQMDFPPPAKLSKRH